MTNIGAFIKSCRKTMREDKGTGSDQLRIWQLGWMIFLKVFSDKEVELENLHENYCSVIPKRFRWDAWAGNDEGITGDELINFVDHKLFPALRRLGADGNKRALLVRGVFTDNNNYMKNGIYLRQLINKVNRINFNDSKDRQVFGTIYETFLGELQSAGKMGEYYTPRAITRLLTELIDPQHGKKVLDPACGTGGFLTAVIKHLQPTAKNVRQREGMERNVMGWEYNSLPYLLANTNLILHGINLPAIRNDDSLAHPLSKYRHADKVDIILANPPYGAVVYNNNEKNFPQNYQTKESADLFLILMIHLLKEGGQAAIVLPDSSLTNDKDDDVVKERIKERIRKKLLEDCNLHTIVRLPDSVFKPYAAVATNLLFFTKGKPTKSIWYWEHKLPPGKHYSKTKPIQYGEFDELRKWWNNRKTGKLAWQVSIEEIAANGYSLDIKNPRKPQEKREENSAELIKQLRKSFAKNQDLLQNFVKSNLTASLRKVRIGSFLFERVGKYSPRADEVRNLSRIEKIDFAGKFHISKKSSNTGMILIKPGDFVISGINAAKGAIGLYEGDSDIAATIHYSSYTFDESIVDIGFFKHFVKSAEFTRLLKEQVKGGIKTEIKAKHLLPIVVNLPPLSDQKKIANLLALCDSLQAEARNNEALAKRLMQAALKEAFTPPKN